MKDYYDKAVEYLTEHPEEIETAWCGSSRSDVELHLAHWLFAHVTPTGCLQFRPGDGRECGCLTLIRIPNARTVAWTEQLTASIAADTRIPDTISSVQPSDLPVFAAWQRKIDAELGRTPPVWPEEVPA